MNSPQNTEKDRSTLAKEPAAAHTEINTHEKEDSMTQSIDYNGHVPTPPAGFTLHYEEDLSGEDFAYCSGPRASSGYITVETFWTIPGGIEFEITNNRHSDNGVFSHDEIIELSRLIREVVAATKLSTIPNAGIKICTTCHEGKPLSEFSKQIAKRDGLQSHCKECAAEYYAKGGTNA